MQEFLSGPLLGRTVYDFALAAAIVVVAVVVLETARFVLLRIVRKKQTPDGEREAPSFFVNLIRRFVIPGLYLGAFYGALRVIRIDPAAWTIVQGVFVVLLTWFVIRFLIATISASFAGYVKNSPEQEAKRLRPLLAVINLAIWIAGLLFLLDNLGFEISAIVAGLGIGGIAVALAAQALLGDLFSYFVIFLDHPFEVGDFLIFEDVLGSVEKIGVKTTRIRSLSGEQIVVSNSALTSAKVRNYKRMQERRIVFTVGVTYDTSSELLREIPTLVREIIEGDEQARFDRCHFKEYGDFSLVFETVYYVLSPDYNLYMDIQQRINLAVFEAFEQRGLRFAFPTRTVHLVSEGAAARG